MNKSGPKSLWVAVAALLFALTETAGLAATERAEQIIAGAKKEGEEIVFIAGAQTFGGKKSIAELEVAFNKKFALKTRINFTAGPSMSSIAARLITEAKAARKSSTDFYLGSQSHFALLHQEKALENVNWSGIFPWLTSRWRFPPVRVSWFTPLSTESSTTRT